jgi:carbonic anhydrase
MSIIDDLLENSKRYAETFDRGDLPSPPAKKIAVVACMDARLIPTRVLGLEEGDAHVIRNAGGVITDDGIRSLAISQHMLGTEEIILMHHTDCGMQSLTDEQFKARLREATGQEPSWDVEAISDLEGSVRESIRRITESPFIPRKSVRGFIYDVRDGSLREVSR